jgi:hypothetical protein
MLLGRWAGALPDKWVGGEAFAIRGFVNHSNKTIVLVPFADAGQTGGAMTTWFRRD